MTGLRRATPHLFVWWERVARRLRRSKRVVVFLDFDGTLVRVAPLPRSVRLEDAARESLRKLAGRRNATVAVISGRQRAELQDLIGIRNVRYLGLYGWENRANRKAPFRVRLALVHTLIDLLARLPGYPEVWIEPKRNTFSVHLKGASSETQRRMRVLVSERVRPQRGILQAMQNLRDVEVAPLSIGDKGAAVRKFLAMPGMRGALPIYFGDDFSDEPAFAAVRKGISILVGRRRATRARYSLRGPAEVAEALSRLEETIR